MRTDYKGYVIATQPIIGDSRCDVYVHKDDKVLVNFVGDTTDAKEYIDYLIEKEKSNR